MEDRPFDTILHLDLTRVGDLDDLAGASGLRAEAFDLLDEVLSLNDLAVDDMASVQPRGDDGGDKELRSVGARACESQEKNKRVRNQSIIMQRKTRIDGQGGITSN